MYDVVIAHPAEAHRSARVVFSDPPGTFRNLVWRGAWLELVTAGFYRFWLATDMRRHLWSRTSIEGDGFEYTGTAKELLLGFLFALAILVPIYLVYFLLGVEAERYRAFASAPLGLLLYAFWQFAIFRSAPIPAFAHDLARRSLLDEWFWLALFAARLFVGTVGACHPRYRAAVARGRAGTLQDAPHTLWRPIG